MEPFALNEFLDLLPRSLIIAKKKIKLLYLYIMRATYGLPAKDGNT